MNKTYKLRLTELILQPGDRIGEHIAVGPGLYLITYGVVTRKAETKVEKLAPGQIVARDAIDRWELENTTDRSCQLLLFHLMESKVDGVSLIAEK